MIKVILKIRDFMNWLFPIRIFLFIGALGLICGIVDEINVRKFRKEIETARAERLKQIELLKRENAIKLEQYRQEHPNSPENLDDPEYIEILKIKYLFGDL